MQGTVEAPAFVTILPIVTLIFYILIIAGIIVFFKRTLATFKKIGTISENVEQIVELLKKEK